MNSATTFGWGAGSGLPVTALLVRCDLSVVSFTPEVREKVARRILATDATENTRLRPEWSASSIDSSKFLTLDACERYRALFDKLESLRDAPDGVEAQAVESGKTVLVMMQFARWSPPQLTWHGGDAVVFFWTIGESTHAITVVEGYLGYIEQRGRMIVRRHDSVAIDGNCFSYFVP